MKFRGLMSDPAAMRDFMNISTSLSKLSKECVMRITTRKVYFIITGWLEDAGPKKPFVWCELPVNFYFKEYTLAGASDEYNEIYLALDTGMLARSLATLKHNAKSLKIKLTNKQTPCITLDIDQLAGQNVQNSRQCLHDIPVEVLPRKEWSDYEEPRFNDFHVSVVSRQVSIQMPNLKSIKNIVERMKTMSTSLIVSANKHGRLTLRIKTNMVTLSAHFPDLSVQSFAVGQVPTLMEDDLEEENETVTTVIDAKKFLMFLTGMHITNCRTVCSIVHGQMVKLHLEQPGALSLQCFLSEMNL